MVHALRVLTLLTLVGACAAAPKTTTPEPAKMTADYRPAVHGHRGARALRPENTLPAFELALELGVDVLELDLAVTKDDVLVLSHDLYASSVICQFDDGAEIPKDWRFRDHTLDEVKELDCGARQNPRFPEQTPIPGTRIPTLEEVFELVKASGNETVQFNIETKIKPAHPTWTPAPERYAELVVETFQKHGLVDRIYLQSFDHRTLRAARKLAPELRRVMLTSDNLVDFVALAQSEGAHISPDQDWITKPDVEALHAAGFEVIPWTANSPEEWQRLVDLRVDAIISDDPGGLIEFLKARGMR
jgi:glycerophosphoryl diester phosphodiesterase